MPQPGNRFGPGMPGFAEQRLAELQQQQQGAANGNANGSDSGIILPASATRQ